MNTKHIMIEKIKIRRKQIDKKKQNYTEKIINAWKK